VMFDNLSAFGSDPALPTTQLQSSEQPIAQPDTLQLSLQAERRRAQEIINKRHKAATKVSAGVKTNRGKRNVLSKLERIFLQEFLRKHGPLVDTESLDATHVGTVWSKHIEYNKDRLIHVGYRQLSPTFSFYEYGKQPVRYAFCECVRCGKILRVQAAKLTHNSRGCYTCAQFVNGMYARALAGKYHRYVNTEQAAQPTEPTSDNAFRSAF
jgi:hypothetical protein